MNAVDEMDRLFEKFEQPLQTEDGIEILCHNLSHSDLVLSINDYLMSNPNGRIIARPGYSYFREISRKVVFGIANDHQLLQIPTILYPKYSRQENNDKGVQLIFIALFATFPTNISFFTTLFYDFHVKFLLGRCAFHHSLPKSSTHYT